MGSPNMSQPARRQPVNLGLVIGVAFVALAAITGWVIFDAVGDGGEDQISTETVASTSTIPVSTTTPTTSPVLMPTAAPDPTTAPIAQTPVSDTTPDPTAGSTEPTTTTSSTTSTPTSSTSTTTTVPAPDLADGGDLGVVGHPITVPDCTGAYITVLGSAVGTDVSPVALGGVLNSYPESHYLRTDQTCASLTQSVNGEPVYVVYYGPYADEDTACAARADGPDDAYVRRLSDTVSAGERIDCGG